MTEPTPDAAKLLPCPFCGGEAILGDIPEENGVAVGCKNCLAYGPIAIHAKEDATHHAIYCWNRRANTRPQPARPKVEDAEVAESMRLMRAREVGVSAYGSTLEIAPDRDCHKAADLLERLAGERDQAISMMQWIDGENSIAMKRAEAAEAKLAETEAELAKAQEFINAFCERGEEIVYDKSLVKIAETAKLAHAARQQQVSADKDGETR